MKGNEGNGGSEGSEGSEGNEGNEGSEGGVHDDDESWPWSHLWTWRLKKKKIL